MTHIIVHSLDGLYLALSKVEGGEHLLYFDSDANWGTYDELSRKVYSEITKENVDLCADSPLAVRYSLQDDTTMGDFLDFFVLEFLSDSRMPLTSDYKWSRITDSLVSRFEKKYRNPLVQAIKSIAVESLGASNVTTVPRFSMCGFMRRLKHRVKCELRKHGYEPVGCLKQLQSGPDSMVFRIDTSKGVVYHKIAGSGALEAAFTKRLGELLPDHVLNIFGVDTDENSFFSKDFGAVFEQAYGYESSDDEAIMTDDAMEKFACFHTDAIEFVDALKAIGMEDTGPRTLMRELCNVARRLQDEEILCNSNARKLMDLAPEVESLVKRLEECHIPSTVCHGDLGMWNMTEPGDDKKPRLFDWYESSISHPFLDILNCKLGSEDRYLGYLSAWQKYENREGLRKSFSAAVIIGPLWETYRMLKIRARMKHTLEWDVDKEGCRFSMKNFIDSLESRLRTRQAKEHF
eukprot:Plantae.Rhodophyta-Hildenbrandia_rubra.ctg36636.p1 GENE.Plantae.Rhodophyta-Hildenbrandia_rubra.ctg36636~~Plantae.Rhodophyta-Hildenbrandia_rubra.ctg36636.p1  ORF type:complete len:462 (-),score=52.74 Plantae.Rhodophyta-Hildenbrandia_rubra.ctg36636:144-1529(-)